MRVKCPICFETCFKSQDEDEQDIIALKCGHIFHRKCIADWYSTNKTCAICRKRSTLAAAVKIFPQYDDEPSEEESKLMSRVRELEEKMIFLQSEVDELKSENRRMKCSVENSKNQSIDYREFMEDLSNDLGKTVKRIDHFRMNMNLFDRERDRDGISKGTQNPNLRKRSIPSSVENAETVVKKKKKSAGIPSPLVVKITD